MRDVVNSQILIPQSCLYLGFNSVNAAHVTIPCTVTCLTYFSLQILKESGHFCFAAVLDLKDFSTLISSRQQYSTSLTVTRPNILVNMVSSDLTAYFKGFCFRCHCTCRIQQFLKRSCNLILKRVCRYNNCRYYCWGRKLMLHKNWALHAIPAVTF